MILVILFAGVPRGRSIEVGGNEERYLDHIQAIHAEITQCVEQMKSAGIVVSTQSFQESCLELEDTLLELARVSMELHHQAENAGVILPAYELSITQPLKEARLLLDLLQEESVRIEGLSGLLFEMLTAYESGRSEEVLALCAERRGEALACESTFAVAQLLLEIDAIHYRARHNQTPGTRGSRSY